MDRREFVFGSGSTVLSLVAGCHVRVPSSAGDDGVSPNYFSTWNAQAFLRERLQERGWIPKLSVPVHARDALNERILFDRNAGLAVTEFSDCRKNLHFVLDDGWDVPYGTRTKESTRGLGALEPDPVRFSSFGATPLARLKGLSRAVRDLGWRSLGLWASPQGTEDSWRRKLDWCAEAEIGYLKVDWGARQYEREFRRFLSVEKRRRCPAMTVEHAFVDDYVEGRKPRPEAFVREVLSFSDVWRIYDVLGEISVPTALARTAYYLRLVHELGGGCLINVEDELALAGGLGCTFGLMPCAAMHRPGKRTRVDRLNWVKAVLDWQRHDAPAFAGTRVAVSKETFSERWREHVQSAPAVVARNMPLPEIRAEGERPYVVCSRHPNGALAVASLFRGTAEAKHIPPADVVFDAPARTIGQFGPFRTIVLPSAGVRRVSADGTDITAACRFRDGLLAIPAMRHEPCVYRLS